jgi:hypothetical protein
MACHHPTATDEAATPDERAPFRLVVSFLRFRNTSRHPKPVSGIVIPGHLRSKRTRNPDTHAFACVWIPGSALRAAPE